MEVRLSYRGFRMVGMKFVFFFILIWDVEGYEGL